MAPAARMTSPAVDARGARRPTGRGRRRRGHRRRRAPSAWQSGTIVRFGRARTAAVSIARAGPHAQPAVLVERQGPDAHRHRARCGRRSRRSQPRRMPRRTRPASAPTTRAGSGRAGTARPDRGRRRARPGRSRSPGTRAGSPPTTQAGSTIARPPFEVLGHAPQEDAAVDGARAAHDAAARERDRAAARGAGRAVAPVELPELLDDGHAADRESDRRRRTIEVGMVAAGLDERHASARILGQARGEHAAGRPAADDDDVVHGRLIRPPAPATRRRAAEPGSAAIPATMPRPPCRPAPRRGRASRA